MEEERPLHAVRPDPTQPRKVFSEASIARLWQSIRRTGLIQPITIRPNGDIVTGERRYRAHVFGNATTIRVIVREHDDKARRLAVQLIENLQREDMNPIDTARGFQNLLDDGWKLEEIADELGYATSTIEAKIGLLKLAPRIQEHVASGQIAETLGIRLTKLSKEGQYLALRKIRNRSIAQAQPIIDAILEREQQVSMFSEPPPAKQQKSLVKSYQMAMLALTGFVRKVTGEDYRVLAFALDDGRMPKRISEIEVAVKALRRIKRELETYQQRKKLRKEAA